MISRINLRRRYCDNQSVQDHRERLAGVVGCLRVAAHARTQTHSLDSVETSKRVTPKERQHSTIPLVEDSVGFR